MRIRGWVSRDFLRQAGAGALAAALISLAWPATGLAAPQPAGQVPAVLVAIGERAEDIYDVVKAADWQKAGHDFGWFDGALKKMDTEVDGHSVNKAHLSAAVAALGNAIGLKSRKGALVEANRITNIVAAMSSSYHPRMPAGLSRLDYDGRELEIWSEAGDMGPLLVAAGNIQRTWARLHPEVVARGGGAEAVRFADLVAQLQAARSPKQYGRLAAPILEEVDRLEALFTP